VGAPLVSSFRRAPGARPLLLGHRGARHRLPENTMAAFRGALEEGADGVELDVRLSADRQVVVIHDSSLERVTSGRDRRNVEALAWADLARVDVGGEQAPPLLATVLDWARGNGALVNIELKHDGGRARELADSVARLLGSNPQLSDQVVLSCFHPGVVRRLSRLLPRFPLGWLVHDRTVLFSHTPAFRLLGAGGVHPNHGLVTAERVVRWHKLGAFVNVWTVNDTARAGQLARLGVDALITDAPARILNAIR
jgi:glycerophosphoryl diester phosphodiesterase